MFGSGNADADLMFVGEAPGANEDKQGLPFVGQAGQAPRASCSTRSGSIAARCSSANVSSAARPATATRIPNEIEACSEYLRSQVELIQPTVICTLGNFSTKLLRGDTTGISRLHGQPEVRTIGARAIRLYPLYHPAAALYTPSTLEVLRADFHRIPELLALGAPEQPELEDESCPSRDDEPRPARSRARISQARTKIPPAAPEPVQLGLF